MLLLPPSILSLLIVSLRVPLAKCQASGGQHPLHSPPTNSGAPISWGFNFSSSAPHYFASVHGLLSQWGNTFFPNGHIIAAAEIPPYTKLYHGRNDHDLPPSPEWLAFDIEMSYGITGSNRNSFMLTYQTTRPVPVLYFDGESATLMGAGQLDSQMLQVWGNVTGPPRSGTGFGGLWEEYSRAIGLCGWLEREKLGGPGWGFEGIVRMNAGFELIWCDFMSPSLRLMSFLNVSAPLLHTAGSNEIGVSEQQALLENTEDTDTRAPTSYYPLPPTPTRTDKAVDPSQPPLPPNWRRGDVREPFLASQAWGWFRSATDHFGSTGSGPGQGENRVKINACGILNYYSPNFHTQAAARNALEQKYLNLTGGGLWNASAATNRTEALTKLMRRRRTHRLDSITISDANTMRADSTVVVRELLSGNTSYCSGVDWLSMTQEIVQMHAVPVLNLRDLFSQHIPKVNQTAVGNWLGIVRDQTHALLLPFLQYPEVLNDDAWSPMGGHFAETFARCKYHHTRLLVREEGVFLNPQEAMLKWAVEEVMQAICTVTVTVGFEVEKIWLRDFNSVSNTTATTTSNTLAASKENWTRGAEELMSFLGWADQWVRCPVCKWDEKCYIPMWPMLRKSGFGRAPPPPGPPDLPPGGQWPPLPGGRPDPGRRRPPGGGWGRGMDETDLWEPTCVRQEDIMGR